MASGGTPGQGSGHKNKPHKKGPQTDHPWEVTIDIYLNSVPANGKPAFDVQTCLPTDWPSGDNPTIKFYNDGRNGFFVKFRLWDNTESDYPYVFIDDPEDALWSQKGSQCPTAKVCEVFTRTKRVDDTTLTAWNMNESSFLFQYALRVSNDDEQSIVTLDPGGANMNGATGFN